MFGHQTEFLRHGFLRSLADSHRLAQVLCCFPEPPEFCDRVGERLNALVEARFMHGHADSTASPLSRDCELKSGC